MKDNMQFLYALGWFIVSAVSYFWLKLVFVSGFCAGMGISCILMFMIAKRMAYENRK